jgi:hypothetical protein
MLIKVREFGRQHQGTFPESSPAGKAFAVVATAAEAIAAEGSGMLLAKETGLQAKAAAREQILERLNGIARTARIVATTAPAAGDLLRLQVPKTDAALVMAVQGIVREGPAAIVPLVPLGVPETVVAELAALLDRFEQADRGGRAGKAARAAARTRLAAAFEPAAEPLRLLDVIVANTFEHDDAVLAAWKRARHVPTAKAKSPRRATAPADTPAPEAAPAADPASTTEPADGGDPLRKAS